MTGSVDGARTNYKTFVLEVKVTWRMIGRNDDWGPWSVTEGTIGDPRMIGWRATAMWHRWTWSPRKASPRRSLTTFRGAGLTGSVVTAQPWVFGRRQASGRGGGVKRHSTVPDPVPMSVSRRTLTRTTALTDATVCSFWSGLTLSP